MEGHSEKIVDNRDAEGLQVNHPYYPPGATTTPPQQVPGQGYAGHYTDEPPAQHGGYDQGAYAYQGYKGQEQLQPQPHHQAQPSYATTSPPVTAAGGGSPWQAPVEPSSPVELHKSAATPPRRALPWLTLSMILNVLLIAALAIVGGVLGKKAASATNDAVVACPVTNSTCPTKNSTDTSSFGTAVSFATNSTSGTTKGKFITPKSDCPTQDNKSSYTVPSTNLTFQLQCSFDYPQFDLGRFPVASMADCLSLCAQLNLYQSSLMGPCIGVSWVTGLGPNDDPQGQGNSFCFPKYKLVASGARDGVQSAVLVS